MNFLNMVAKNFEYFGKLKLQNFKLCSYPSFVKLG